MNQIRLTILNAQNLPNKDSGAYLAHLCERKKDVSDSYVIAQVGQQQQRTATVVNNLNPIYNENFFFVIKDPQKDVLVLSIFDHDQYGKDDFIGVTALPVSMFKINQPSKLTVTLTVPCKCCSKKIPPSLNLEATLLESTPHVSSAPLYNNMTMPMGGMSQPPSAPMTYAPPKSPTYVSSPGTAYQSQPQYPPQYPPQQQYQPQQPTQDYQQQYQQPIPYPPNYPPQQGYQQQTYPYQ
jgi:hypothetical protein